MSTSRNGKRGTPSGKLAQEEICTTYGRGSHAIGVTALQIMFVNFVILGKNFTNGGIAWPAAFDFYYLSYCKLVIFLFISS